jgi:hypothetical protein
MEYVTLLSSNATTATFLVETPGIYQFSYRYTEDDCSYWISPEEIIVPARADFAYSVHCANGQYSMDVYNNSEYLPSIANVTIVADVFTNAGHSTNSANPMLGFITIPVYPGSNTLTWTVQSTNASTGAPFPDCSKTQVIELPPYPTAAFTIDEISKCPKDFFHLQPDNYNPNGVNNKYEWTFYSQSTGNEVTNYLPIVDFMPPVDGDYDITLKEWNDYGCVVTSTSIPVTVLNSKLEVTVVRTPSGNLCQGDYVDLKLVDAEGHEYNYLPHYQWMNANKELTGENSATLRVTRSGAYWAKLTTSQGCEALFSEGSMLPLNVEFNNAPDVKINTPAGLCRNCEGFWLEARVSNPQENMQYRWLSASGTIPSTEWQNVTDDSGIISRYVSVSDNTLFPTQPPAPPTIPPTVTPSNSYPASDTYTIEVRYAATGCTASASRTVSFSTSPDPSTLDYSLDYITYQSTGLYQAEIKASNTQNGTFIWSNGTTGYSNVVSHGGVYEVIFVNEYGCRSKAEIVLPRDPKEYMWVVPEKGCYTICDNEYLMVIGPDWYAKFFQWNWLWRNYPIMPGTNDVTDNPIRLPRSGSHALELSVADSYGNVLTATSKQFEVTFIDCSDCKFDVNAVITQMHSEDYVSFEIALTITNPTTYNLILTFNANPLTDGFFVPATAFLPAGATQTFNLTYIVNNPANPIISFNIIAEDANATDIQDVPNNLNPPENPNPTFSCSQLVSIETNNFKAPQRQSDKNENLLFSVEPNPAQEHIVIDYNGLEKGSNRVSVYNISGKLIWSSNASGNAENSYNLDVSSWVAGYYIVVLKHNESIVRQQFFVKK